MEFSPKNPAISIFLAALIALAAPAPARAEALLHVEEILRLLENWNENSQAIRDAVCPTLAYIPEEPKSPPLPEGKGPVNIRAHGISVEVTRQPYGYVIRGDDGKEIYRHLATRIKDSDGTARDLELVLRDFSDGRLAGELRAKDGKLEGSLLLEILPGGTLRVKLANSGEAPDDKRKRENVRIHEAFDGKDAAFFGTWVYPWDRTPGSLAELPKTEVGLDNRGVRQKILGGRNFGRGGNWSSTRAPFFLTDKGYAVWANTTAEGEYNFGNLKQSGFNFNDSALEYFVFTGKDPKELLQRYRDTAGAAKMPPDWALGISWWRDEMMEDPRLPDGTQAKDLADVMKSDFTELRKMGVPISFMILDRPYLKSSGNEKDIYGWGKLKDGNFEFDFADPKGTLALFRDEGIEIVAWTTNRVEGDIRKEAERLGYTFGNNSGAIDLRKPGAAEWWKAKLKFLADHGIKGFKIDRGDEFGAYTWGDGTWHVLKDVPPHAANLHSQVSPATQAEVLKEAFSAEDTFTISRAAYDKAREYGTSWSADTFGWLGLEQAVRQTIRAGYINFPNWGTDVGGYNGVGTFGPPDPALMARWAEFAAYSPQMQLLLGKGREPWKDFAPADRARFLEAVRTKQDLLPYVRSLTRHASDTGTPIVRALYLEFPGEARLKDHSADYMLGDSLLVAPIYAAGAKSRKVTLPPGKWLDYDGRRTVHEGKETTVALDAKGLPVFVREGAIIPRGDLLAFSRRNDPAWSSSLRVEAFPQAQDGTSHFDFLPANRDLGMKRIEMKRVGKSVEVRAPALGTAGEIELNGELAGEVYAAGRRLELGTDYVYDEEKRKLRLFLKADRDVDFRVEGFRSLFEK